MVSTLYRLLLRHLILLLLLGFLVVGLIWREQIFGVPVADEATPAEAGKEELSASPAAPADEPASSGTGVVVPVTPSPAQGEESQPSAELASPLAQGEEPQPSAELASPPAQSQEPQPSAEMVSPPAQGPEEPQRSAELTSPPAQSQEPQPSAEMVSPPAQGQEEAQRSAELTSPSTQNQELQPPAEVASPPAQSQEIPPAAELASPPAQGQESQRSAAVDSPPVQGQEPQRSAEEGIVVTAPLPAATASQPAAAPPPDIGTRLWTPDSVSAENYNFRSAEPQTTGDDADITDVAVLLDEARRNYWDGDLVAAINRYQALLGQFPDKPDIHGELGNVYYSSGRTDEAVEQYRRAAALLREAGDDARADRLLKVLQQLTSSAK